MMKRYLLTLLLAGVCCLMQAADITAITRAFTAGNASSLTAVMDEEVDMAVQGTAKKCNASDAVAMLNDFFSGNKPTEFNLLHHADKKDNGFFVSKLITAGGEFRVNITYRGDGDKAIIQSIRIE